MIKFPQDFKFGFSLSGFQFEMGGKEIDPNTDWFVWVHDPINISLGLVSGDFPEHGSNYWELYEKYHDYLEKGGFDIIRIGLEWSRIFPEATFDLEVQVNQEGYYVKEVNVTEEDIEKLESKANMKAVEHYRRMIEDLKKRGVKVIVDLSHFSLPLWLHDPICMNRKPDTCDKKGWVDTKSVIEFAKYAAFVAKKLGDIVDEWSTMNEPQIVSQLGYLMPNAGFPPGIVNLEYYWLSLLNQAQAHARAYENIKKFTGKRVGIIYSFTWVDPLTEEDKDVIDEAMYFLDYLFMDMITKGVVTYNGKEFVEREDMKDKVDYIGVNYYTRTVIKKLGKDVEFPKWAVIPNYGYACEEYSISKAGRPTTQMGWEVYPEGLEKVLLALHERYKLPMYVTENGLADIYDKLRSYFIVSHLVALKRAIDKGADVNAYLHWSLMDNYEWPKGFSKRFGILYVDYETKKIFPRPSYYIYSKIAKEKGIDDDIINYAYYPDKYFD